MYKAVIFDMDGVLIDSQPLYFEIDASVLRQCGIENASIDDVRGYAGISNADRMAMYQKDFNIDMRLDDIMDILLRTVDEAFNRDKLVAIDGVKELLALIKEKGMKLAVASSSPIDFIGFILNEIGIKEYFDVVVSGEDVPNGKPAPDVFLVTAKKLNLGIDECVIIEDSKNGVLSAYNAGIACIGYKNKNSGGQDLSKSAMTIDSFYELIDDFSVLLGL